MTQMTQDRFAAVEDFVRTPKRERTTEQYALAETVTAAEVLAVVVARGAQV